MLMTPIHLCVLDVRGKFHGEVSLAYMLPMMACFTAVRCQGEAHLAMSVICSGERQFCSVGVHAHVVVDQQGTPESLA